MSRTRRVLLYHLPVILYAVAIVTLSSIPYLGGPKMADIGLDKLIHAVEYGIFAWLVLRAFRSTQTGGLSSGMILLTILLVAAFAGMDEYVQSFVPGRDYSVADFAADQVGSLISAWVWRSRKGQN